MLFFVGFILLFIGLSLCLIVVKDAFRSSWRHGVFVLVFLPVAAPLYVYRGYSGDRLVLGLGMTLTLGLGAIALIVVYVTAMQSTSSFRQIAEEQGYDLRLTGVRYRRDPVEYPQGIYIYTLRSAHTIYTLRSSNAREMAIREMQGPLLDEEELHARARVFNSNVLDRYHNEQRWLRAAEPSQYRSFVIRIVLFIPPNGLTEIFVTGDGELIIP